MLIITDKNRMLKEVRYILDRNNIDLDAYRREHNIPSDYLADIVHTDGDYAVETNECGMTVRKINEEPLDVDELRETMKNAMERTSMSFYSKFCYYCDSKGLDEVDVYKKAGIDRKTFSKMRKSEYRTSKDNILALGLSMGLYRYELEDLMHSAGVTLDKSDQRDTAIDACLMVGCNELDKLDYILNGLGLPTIKKYD